MDRDFKGVWIPKEIWLDETLTIMEKMLLVEIDSLCGEKGCWATNQHLAKFLGISKDRVSKLISGLVKRNYLKITIKYVPGTKQVKERVLFTTIGYGQKQLEGIGENTDTPPVESTGTPIGENNEESNTGISNTSFSNTLSNTKHTAREDGENRHGEEKGHTPSQKRFDEFWSAYPRKVGKGAAEKAYAKIKPDQALQDQIMGAIADAKQSFSWRKDNGQYIPNPATWLNQRRWEDELEAQTSSVIENPQAEMARRAIEVIMNGG